MRAVLSAARIAYIPSISVAVPWSTSNLYLSAELFRRRGQRRPTQQSFNSGYQNLNMVAFPRETQPIAHSIAGVFCQAPNVAATSRRSCSRS
jgi:hypothetical protein